MKKIALSLVLVASLSSCSSTKSTPQLNSSTIATATSLINALTPNSTLGQITNIFNLLDVNKDSALGSTETIGAIADNFNILDKDNSSNLNVTELAGLLKLLK